MDRLLYFETGLQYLSHSNIRDGPMSSILPNLISFICSFSKILSSVFYSFLVHLTNDVHFLILQYCPKFIFHTIVLTC